MIHSLMILTNGEHTLASDVMFSSRHHGHKDEHSPSVSILEGGGAVIHLARLPRHHHHHHQRHDRYPPRQHLCSHYCRVFKKKRFLLPFITRDSWRVTGGWGSVGSKGSPRLLYGVHALPGDLEVALILVFWFRV